MTKILVVDDSVFMRTVIRDMISKDPSLEVVGTAIDGVDALNKLESLSPDVMTLDIEMPRMSGIEVLEKIEKWPSRPRILMPQLPYGKRRGDDPTCNRTGSR